MHTGILVPANHRGNGGSNDMSYARKDQVNCRSTATQLPWFNSRHLVDRTCNFRLGSGVALSELCIVCLRVNFHRTH